jgi:hypothetical protein
MEHKEDNLTFQEADRRYADLKRQRDAGELSAAAFDAQLQELMIQDLEGRWWAKSRSTGEWHYHDDNGWVRETPPSDGVQRQQKTELPETFVKRLVEVCARYSGRHYYVGEAIPEGKLADARKFFPIPLNERVFALIDNSGILNKGAGLALGEAGIYWTTSRGRAFLTWQEFSTVPIAEDRWLRGYIVEMGKGKKFVGYNYAMPREAAVQLLRELQSLIKASPAGSET